MSWSDGFEKSSTKSKYPSTLKLPVGSSVIEIMGEPEEVSQPDLEHPDKMVTKLIFPVKYQDQIFSWWVAKGYVTDRDGNPKQTLFAQLSRIDKSREGGIVGSVLKVTAFGDNKGRRYLAELK